jgi:PKD repeat protein
MDASTDSDGSILSRTWDFGDGSTTNATNPSHGYATGGDYTVSLTVRDDGGLTHTAQQVVSPVAPPPPPPPPPNEAPTAAFTYSCSELTCTFTESSTDSDGTVVAWVWDMGDGTGTSARNPTYTYEFAGTYTVELRVTDDGGLVGTTQQTITVTAPPSASLVLSANGYRRSGRHVVDLTWLGTSVPVDVYRNGVVLATVPSTPPTYRDYARQAGKATYVYRVCEAGTAICSNEVTVEF